jgi:putative acetyltransferase
MKTKSSHTRGNAADPIASRRPTDQYFLRRATNRDAAGVWRLISTILSGFGIVTNRQTTDGDLVDINAHYDDRGGIFFLLLDGRTMIGTVALRRESSRSCELCRMYLASEYRGQGLGRRLFDHALAEARRRGFREIYLKTASVLTTAISLYERAGFRRVPGKKAGGNCDLVMRMNLD